VSVGFQYRHEVCRLSGDRFTPALATRVNYPVELLFKDRGRQLVKALCPRGQNMLKERLGRDHVLTLKLKDWMGRDHVLNEQIFDLRGKKKTIVIDVFGHAKLEDPHKLGLPRSVTEPQREGADP
jgi:hypothetical protein